MDVTAQEAPQVPTESWPTLWVVRDNTGAVAAITRGRSEAFELYMHRSTHKAPWFFSQEPVHPQVEAMFR